MPRFSFEELQSLEQGQVATLEPGVRRLTPEEVQGRPTIEEQAVAREAAISIGLPEDSIDRKIGVDRSDLQIRMDRSDQASSILRKVRSGVLNLAPLGIKPGLLANELEPLEAFQGSRVASEFNKATGSQIPDERDRENRRLRSAMEDEIPVMRETNVGVETAVLRSASIFVRGLESIGLADDGIADEMNRAAGRVSEVRREIAPQKVFGILENAVSSLATAFTVAGVGSALGAAAPVVTAGVIGQAGIQAANEALTEGKDAGLKGGQLGLFALNAGAIEAVTTSIFSMIKLGGVEDEVLKPFIGSTKKGILNGLKRLGINGLGEVPEEVIIELAQAANKKMLGVDPNALTSENWQQIVMDTTVQTLATVGLATTITTAAGAAGEVAPEVEGAQEGAAAPEVQTRVPAQEALQEAEPQPETIRIAKETHRQLKEAVNQDRLTGLGSRDFDERAAKVLTKRADREGQSMALVSFDISNFKSINDKLGLQAGDQALQIIGNAIQSQVRTREGRPSDVAGIATRPGGDEFNLMLRNADKAAAEAVLARIQKKADADLKKAGLDLPAEGRPVLAIGGIVVRQPNDPRTFEELRKEADFDVKRRKATRKEELGVPLTREEVEAAPAPEPEVIQPVSTAKTPSQLKAIAQKAPERLTPSQLKAAQEGKPIAKPKRVARPGVPVLKEAKTAQQAFRAGEREATRRAQAKLAQVKTDLRTKAKSEESIRKEMATLVQEMLPVSERGRFNKAIANAKTERQLQAARGRLLREVERLAKKAEAKRLNKQLSQLKPAKLHSAVQEMFKDQLETLKSANLRKTADLRLGQLIDLGDMATQINHMQAQIVKMTLGGQAKSLDEHANEASETLKRTAKETKFLETPSTGMLKRFLDEENAKPETLAMEMDGFKENGIFQRVMIEDLAEGRSEQFRVEQEAEDFINKRFDFPAVRNWSAMVVGKKKASKVNVRLESGTELEMFEAQYVSLLAHLDDPETRELIKRVGISKRNILAQRHKITDKDIATIEGQAKPEHKKAMRALKDYVNGPLKDQLNKAHEDLNGLPIATRENFWSRKRNQKDEIPSKFDIGSYTRVTLEGMGILKERTGGSTKSVMIDDIFTEFDNHIRKVGGFIGLAMPMRNANLFLNHPRVLKNMDARLGTQRAQAFQRRLDVLAQEIAGYRPEQWWVTIAANKLIRNTTLGVLSINPGVVLKQPVSIAAAKTEIDFNLLFQGLREQITRSGQKEIDDRMFKHSPNIRQRYKVNRVRLVGQLDDKSGTIFGRTKSIAERLMAGISGADQIAIRSIWRATELEISKNAKSLGIRINSPEYWKAVDKRATQIIRRTQPTFDLLDQSGIGLQSRTHPLAKLAAAMFMSQRNQNYNMMRRSFSKFKSGKKAEAARDMAIIAVISPLFIHLIDELRRWAYGNQDDKEVHERVIEAMLSLVENNLATLYGSDTAVAAVRTSKNWLTGSGGRFKSPNNIIEGSVQTTIQGGIELFQAPFKINERFEAGPQRGESVAFNKLMNGLVNFGIGVGSLTGKVPGSPIRIVAGFGEKIFETDYAHFWKERQRLNKLNEKDKLNDVDRERFGLIEMALTKANMAHLAAEKEQITRDDANSVISDEMRNLVLNLEKLDGSVVQSTLPPRTDEEEKIKSQEEALRPFYKEHGSDILRFNILRKEIGAAQRNMDQLPRGRRRVFLRDNPDQAQLIRLKPRMDEINKQLNVIRKQLANPGMSESRRATLNRSAARLLARAQQLRP